MPALHGVLVTDLPVGADPELEQWLGDGPARVHPSRRADDAGAAHGGDRATWQRIRVSDQPSRRHGRARSAAGRSPGNHCSACGKRRTCRSASASACRGPSRRAAVAALADGVVVGSAIVRAADESVAERDRLWPRRYAPPSTRCRHETLPLGLLARVRRRSAWSSSRPR